MTLKILLKNFHLYLFVKSNQNLVFNSNRVDKKSWSQIFNSDLFSLQFINFGSTIIRCRNHKSLVFRNTHT